MINAAYKPSSRRTVSHGYKIELSSGSSQPGSHKSFTARNTASSTQPCTTVDLPDYDDVCMILR